ncbi:MAG: hypothetical protein AB7U43_09720, partial [Desulfobacter sp.]
TVNPAAIVIISEAENPATITNQNIDVVVVESISIGPQGAPGTPGTIVNTISPVAAVALGGHRVIAIDDDGCGIYADYLMKHDRVAGISTGAVEAGKPLTIVVFGEIEESSWSFDTSKGLFLGSEGVIVQDALEFGAIVPLGYVMTPTRIFVSIGTKIERE